MSAVDEIAAYLAHLKTGGNRIDQIIFDELPNGEEMNATDDLRRLLDERGVEWQDFDDEPTWMGSDGEMHYARQEFTFDGPTGNVTVYHLTPAQAVEATLGSDLEAENEQLRKERDFYFQQVTENGERAHEAIDALNAENANLRELVRNVEHYERFGCQGCPHSGICGAGTLYDEDCAMSREIERGKRELGIKVDA